MKFDIFSVSFSLILDNVYIALSSLMIICSITVYDAKYFIIILTDIC